VSTIWAIFSPGSASAIENPFLAQLDMNLNLAHEIDHALIVRTNAYPSN
jgi:hypothetical protein